ncbi:MAG TPA: DNA topoisomerase IB [Chloroflexota bacterium]
MAAILAADPAEAAKEAGLRYVTDALPGIRRKKAGHRFVYLDPKGHEVTDPDERLRIKALAVPPAWTDVWISPDPRGHLQATGRDARGRKQYRYHTSWREVRDRAKYDHLVAFGASLPAIRRQVQADLRLSDLPRRKILAALVELLETTLIRVGNDEYARDNDSYGLTTLHDQHAHVNGSEVRFTFRGKSGKEHKISLKDARLARIVKRSRDIPGQRLFQYVNGDGQHHAVYSEDVNHYLHEIAGQEFTAKDFRTWNGTVLAAHALRDMPPFESQAQAKKNLLRAVDQVADRLGNTRAISRKCYIHPAIVQAYMEGALAEQLARAGRPRPGLSQEEEAVLSLLDRSQATHIS